MRAVDGWNWFPITYTLINKNEVL